MARALLAISSAALLFVILHPDDATAAVVREAHISVVFSPGACEVTSRFVIDTADPVFVDHRLMLVEQGGPPAFALVGAMSGDADTVGRTARLPVSLARNGRNEYVVRYRFGSPQPRGQRCPLLVPSTPTEGLNRSVTLDVRLPEGAARLPGDFPAFAWTGERGTVTLGHVPAFVRAPYAPAGGTLTWRDRLDFRKAIDAAAIFAVGIATLTWVMLRRPRA